MPTVHVTRAWCVLALTAAAAAVAARGEVQRMEANETVAVPAIVSRSVGDPIHECQSIDNPADLLYCTTADIVKLTDCSRIDKKTIIAAPYLTAVTEFYLTCSALTLYLPVLARVAGVLQIEVNALTSLYLFSLHELGGSVWVTVRTKLAVFEAPFLWHADGVVLKLKSPFVQLTAADSTTTSLIGRKDDDLCGVDKTLRSDQIKALQQNCDLGDVHWDSLEMAGDRKLLFAAGDSCAATSIRNATFLNVPVEDSDSSAPITCPKTAYLGDTRSPRESLALALTIQNSALRMYFDGVSTLYGGVFMAASMIMLSFYNGHTFHGFRFYQSPPPLDAWTIQVPDQNAGYKTMTTCLLMKPGQFAPFTPNMLRCQ